MKRYIILLALMLNLVPYMQDGRINCLTNQACAQIAAQEYVCTDADGTTFASSFSCDMIAGACTCSICYQQYPCNEYHDCPKRFLSYCIICNVYYDCTTQHTCPTNPLSSPEPSSGTSGGSSGTKISISADCSAQAEQNAKDATTLQNDIYNAKNIGLDTKPINGRTDTFDKLGNYAISQPNEAGFVVRYYDEPGYYTGYCVSGKIEGTTTGIEMGEIYQSTIATGHTHPLGDPLSPNLTGPSSGDFLNTVKFNNVTGGNYEDSYIYSYNNIQYVLHIDDSAKAKAYYDNNQSLFTLNGQSANARSFASGSALRIKYDKMYSDMLSKMPTPNNLIVKWENENAAHDFAMANIMKDAGVSLLKKDANSNGFKQMDLTVDLPANGIPVYKPSKCK